ncbi:MAG TPA: serine/threonine-protein kinase [Terriglobales bacterium]|jgi:serine/threonine protein kinase|nr:serine/threonine-protein kinase [Terriglobales bacterium]
MSTKIGRFEIQAEISRSFTGSVNKACDSVGGQIVALKVVDLKPFGANAAPVVKRILEEAESSKLLNTHNIAMLFGAGEIEGKFCATMEYVQGNSIETMLERKEVFSIWDVQDIARQCCQGLDHARVNKVLHYSLEPGKVMVQWDGIVKMLGFGVSMMGVSAAEFCPGIPKILHYMSPEQIQGQPLDASSNLFSLGAIVYEMVTQQKAFNGEDPDQVQQSVLEMMPAPPCEINPKIDPALSDVIMKSLAKVPSDRYQSGQELINDLEKCKNNPVKTVAANKTMQPAAAVKASQGRPPAPVATEPQQKREAQSAPSIAPRVEVQAPANARTAAAAAGAGTPQTAAPTLQSLKAATMDSSQQFISTCIKASIDAVIKPEAKMSTATLEPEVKAPKIAVDPMMDESRKAGVTPSRSFSEIDELPPLKEVYVSPPPPLPASSSGSEDILLDEPSARAYAKSETAPAALPVREIARKAVVEIKKTPPKMFLYSIGAAVAVILVISAIIALRIRSDSADDQSTSRTAIESSVASASTTTSNSQSSPVRQSTMQLPIASESPSNDSSDVSVKGKFAAKKKAKAKVEAPQPLPVVIPAQLMVNSNPAGGQIQIDGRGDPSWITPYNISGLPPGQHTVYISKAGFAPEIRTIDAISGGKSTVMVHFNQLPSTVFFVSAPVGASIFVDGKDTGHVTPAQISLDRPGSHTLLVKKPGYLDETTTANLAPGQTFHYSPTLIALGDTDNIRTVGKIKKFFGSNDPIGMGIVSIKVQPKGAQIAVNSRLLEKLSPVDFYLNPGTYVVDMTLSGYKTAHHVVTVTRGGKVTLDDVLEPQ